MTDSLDQFIKDALREFDGPTGILAESPGDQIAHYTLIEELGAGGFGIVWRAEQSQPVRRQVALKILKAGMDTREVVARFKAERQALAVLDHPGVAKVLDAGATPAGRPFFVMELVHGTCLITYCRRHLLPLREQLLLFIEICRAVQHAHQKGLIHRDLKPSNILVTETDGKPQPKVIDFGIAKVIGDVSLAESALVTRENVRMGTPAYMSPEQEKPGMDIDTRADIYSLGVVLYEMLTGEVPFPPAKTDSGHRPRDPQRPSTKIKSRHRERPKASAGMESFEDKALPNSIEGDLDWIVMKAIDQDRTRRYDSVEALGDDVLAYLQKQPVSAHPPTPWYLLKRFTQRNKLAVSAAALILLTLVAGVTTSTVLFFREKQALVRSEQVAKFMKEILAEAGPSKALGDDTAMLRKIIDRTAQRLETELNDQPQVKAELHGVLSRTYHELDEFERSLQHSQMQLELVHRHGGGVDALGSAWLDRAYSFEVLGRMKEAEADARAALAERQRTLGENDFRTAAVHGWLAWILLKSGRPLEGESSAKIAVAAWRKNPTFPDLTSSATALAAIYHNTGRHDEAIAIYTEQLSILRQHHGQEHPDVLLCLDNLGVELCRVKRFDEAEPLLLESLRQGEIMHPKGSPVADHAYAGLSRVAASRSQWDLQLKYARDAVAAAKRVYAPGHRYYLESTNVLSGVLVEQAGRRLEEAWKTQDIALAKQALAFLDEVTGSSDFSAEQKKSEAWLQCLRGRAWMLDAAKQEDAKRLLQLGLDALQAKTKPSPEDTRRIQKAQEWLKAR